MVRFYENIDVLREARLCVKDDGITANNQVSNAMGMEGGQKVFVILEHPAPSPNPSVRRQFGPVPQRRPSVRAPAGSANTGIRQPSSRQS
jgi:hypothetical protein